MAETKEKIIPVSFKSLEGDSLGTFVGTLSTYGNVDFVGDVCEKAVSPMSRSGRNSPSFGNTTWTNPSDHST